MDIEKLTLDKKVITFRVSVNADQTENQIDGERRTVEAHEAPLPELPKAFSACRLIFCEMLEIPDAANYKDKITVVGLDVIRTQAGTRSVKLRGKVQLESRKNYLHKQETPFIQIDPPANGENGEMQVNHKQKKALCKLLEEATNYAHGQRSQQRLDFDADALNEQVAEGDKVIPGLF